MNRIFATIPLLFVCLLPVLAQSGVGYSPRQREVAALLGLDSIVVDVRVDGARKGFDSGSIRDTIEKRLKAEGLPIVGPTAPSKARLLVTVTSSAGVVLTRVQLLGLASMMCDKDIFYVPMWERERFGKVVDVSFVVDAFAADDKSVNGR
jgi:hypothetical protein